MSSNVNSRINPEVIVIGAGIVGSMVTKALRAEGFKVLLIDNDNPLAASKCSSGMWSESWIPKRLQKFYEESIDFIQRFHEIDIIPSTNHTPIKIKGKIKSTEPRVENLNFLDWKKICDQESDKLQVVSIVRNIVTCIQNKNRGQHHEFLKTQFVAKYAVFICAGAFTDDILSKSGYATLGLDKYFGTAIETQDLKNKVSKWRYWAPFKKFLAARVGKTLMKFTNDFTVKNPVELGGGELHYRVHEALKIHIRFFMGKKYKFHPIYTKEMFGVIPAMKVDYKGDFVTKHDTGLYSCTGTGKYATWLSGYLAQRAVELTKEQFILFKRRKQSQS